MTRPALDLALAGKMTIDDQSQLTFTHFQIFYKMKKTFPITLTLAIGLFFYLPSVSAQQCLGCTKAKPTEVHTSTKNSLTISGPPDGKGKPVEYQVFTQSKDGNWKFETAGVVDKPGATQTHSYYRPVQLMVLIFCETPFGSMVAFSGVKVAAPPSKE